MIHRSRSVEEEPVVASRVDASRDEAYPAARENVYTEEIDDRAHAVPRWGVADILGLVAGIFFVVLGVAAVSRTGFDTDHIYTPQQAVWHFPHSPLFSLIEIGFGVLLILAAVVPDVGSSFLAFLGAISFAFGLVILVDASNSRLTEWLGVTHRSGWLYTIVGAVILVAALTSTWLTPGARSRRRRSTMVRSA